MTVDWALFGYRMGWRLVRYLPQRLVGAGFHWGADWASRRGRGMPQLRKNLSYVVGAEAVTDRLIRDAVRSYARYWMEVFRLSTLVSEEFFDQVRESVEGREHLEQSIASGRGVVLTLPHSGNWDVAGAWLAHDYGEFTTVVERLKPEGLFREFLRFRESLGFRVIPDRGGKSRPFEQLAAVLQGGGIVVLMGERDLKATGVPVEFFGAPTTVPAGPAALALSTGACLHAVHCFFTDTGWGFTISPEIEVDQLQPTAQRIACEFEKGIGAHPQDWHVLQPVWRGE